MRILILGGGSVGGKLALDLEEPFALIEADPSRVWELKELLKHKEVKHSVIHGDGNSFETIERAGGKDFDAAVVLMNRDLENLEAVSILRSIGIQRVIARVNSSHNMYKFIGLGAEVFQHPIGYEEGLIRTMLFPDVKHALQIFVREDSPAIGCNIRNLGLPKGAVIGSILREESLIPPTPRTHIKAGDLIALDTVGKSAKRVWKIFSKFGKVESTGHILYPITKEKDLAAVKEVELLAKRMGSEIKFITYKGREDLVTSARGYISKRVPYSVTSAEEGKDTHLGTPERRSLNVSGLGKLGKYFQNLMLEHMEDGSPHLDIFVIPGPQEKFLYMPFISHNLDKVILGAPMPVLISRLSKRYGSILLYLHPHCNEEISIAIQMSRAMGSKLTALYKPKNNKRAQYLQRFAQVYDVKVDIKKIVGNPTVELVKELKEGEHDFIILKKHLKDIQDSQMRRIVHLWTGSVLLVP